MPVPPSHAPPDTAHVPCVGMVGRFEPGMQPNMRPSFSQRLYPYRRPLTWLLHGCLVPLAYLGAYELRFEFAIPPVELRRFFTTLPLLVVLRPASFYVFGLFRDYWRHVSLRDLANVILAVTLGSVAFVGLLYVTAHFRGMSRAVLVLDWLLAIFLVGGFRFGARIAREVQVLRRLKVPQGKRTFIIGAGEAGEQLLRQLLHEPRRTLRVVGLIDDDPDTHGRSLHGVRVLGGTVALPQLAAAHRVQLLVIAVPSATRAELQRIVERCVEAKLPFQILPRLQDLLAGRAKIRELRDVQLEDLLGREPVTIRLDEVERDLAGKTILITGGGGSIGSELARKVARFRPRRIVLLDRAENTLYFAAVELHRAHPDIELLPVIANVTNYERVGEIFRTYQPTYVYHAAALPAAARGRRPSHGDTPGGDAVLHDDSGGRGARAASGGAPRSARTDRDARDGRASPHRRPGRAPHPAFGPRASSRHPDRIHRPAAGREAARRARRRRGDGAADIDREDLHGRAELDHERGGRARGAAGCRTAPAAELAPVLPAGRGAGRNRRSRGYAALGVDHDRPQDSAVRA